MGYDHTIEITDEMIERAALALLKAAWTADEWAKIGEDGRDRWRGYARAALEAALLGAPHNGAFRRGTDAA